MTRFPSFRCAPALRGLLLAALATTVLACESTPTPATETPTAETPAAATSGMEEPAAGAPAAGAPATPRTEGATTQPSTDAPATQPTGTDEHAGHGEHGHGEHGHGDHGHAADPAAGGGMDHGLAEGTYDPADVVAQPGAQIGQLARCPISGEVFRVEETSAYYDHEEQRVYFCCASCIRRFQRDPSQYL